MDIDTFKNLKVAIVHDWLTGMRGGEKVLQEILQIFPEADVFTLLHNKDSVSEDIEKHNIYTSFIQKIPFSAKKYRNFLSLFPAAIESFDFNGYDLVISSSHCVAKGAIVPSDIPHLCYIHTPMRYAYEMYHHYFGKETAGAFKRLAVTLSMPKIRTWDQATHTRVDAFAANSNFVAGRVKRYYGREADVVNPPVDTEFYKPSEGLKEDYYLVISALEPYKRIDLAIDAFNKNKMKLRIVGNGSKYKDLKKRASDNIEFLGRLNDDEIRTLYQNAKAFIFPGIEDFGITPVEAQACGTPVIAFGRGGATETVIHKKTGVLFDEQTVDGLNGAIDILGKIDFNKKTLRENSERFSKGSFHKNFIAFLKKNLSY